MITCFSYEDWLLEDQPQPTSHYLMSGTNGEASNGVFHRMYATLLTKSEPVKRKNMYKRLVAIHGVIEQQGDGISKLRYNTRALATE